MTEVIIQKIERHHIPEILEIEHQSFSTPWSEASFYNETYNPNSLSYTAILEFSVVGYICIRHIGDEAHILNLAVRPDMRRHGIARTLVLRIIGELRETPCKTIYLEVRVSNYQARALYEALGFKVVGIRKAYYEFPKEDAVMMALSLSLQTSQLCP